MENSRRLNYNTFISLLSKEAAIKLAPVINLFACYSYLHKDGSVKFRFQPIDAPKNRKSDVGKTIYGFLIDNDSILPNIKTTIPFLSKEDFPFYATNDIKKEPIEEDLTFDGISNKLQMLKTIIDTENSHINTLTEAINAHTQTRNECLASKEKLVKEYLLFASRLHN